MNLDHISDDPSHPTMSQRQVWTYHEVLFLRLGDIPCLLN